MVETKPFRVLSLDGGGMRGVYTATYLASLADAYARKRGVAAIDLGASCDLIVGTSTGGIIACALAAGIRLELVASLYERHGRDIFPLPVPGGVFQTLWQWRQRPKALEAGDTALREALVEHFGSETLGELYGRRKIALAIPAVEMSQHKGWIFKTPHWESSNDRDNDYALVDICLATSAAPIFRSMAYLERPNGSGANTFVDGGLWANNPVLVSLIESLDIAKPGQKIEVFSMGTCSKPAGENVSKEEIHRGLSDWKFGGHVAGLAIDAQESAYHQMATMLSNHLDRDCDVVQFPRQPAPAELMKYLDLDDTRPEAITALINQARIDADWANGQISRNETREHTVISELLNNAPRSRFCAPTRHNKINSRRLGMFDCSKDVLAHHDEEITLRQADRNEMADRRDANRTRLKNGLEKAERPAPTEFASQGSYAMKTMTQHPENDYDIDDGVYFLKDDLVGPRGADMTALEARQMVRDAVDDGSFKQAPEVRVNCVRIYYNAGYHVDQPVYRRVKEENSSGAETTYHELAGSDWKRSDARDVTKWFDEQNTAQSPDSTNGRQLRRITRAIKKFARSRPSWKGSILSGFGITKLVTECYRANDDREDTALYDTMKAIRDRLEVDLSVEHPVTPGDTITSGEDDPKARFLRDKLSDAMGWLDPLFEDDCSREEALKSWDKTFRTKFFIGRLGEEEEEAKNAGAGASVLTAGLLKSTGASPAVAEAVDKKGGGRYA